MYTNEMKVFLLLGVNQVGGNILYVNMPSSLFFSFQQSMLTTITLVGVRYKLHIPPTVISFEMCQTKLFEV